MMLALALVVSAVVGVVVAAATPPILRRLPEPQPDSGESVDTEPKIAYATLATTRFAVSAGTVSAAATTLALIVLPGVVWPLWLVLGTLGVLLAAIDAATTWLPLRLVRAAWAGTAGALVVVGVLAGLASALRGAAGFALAGAVFWVVWRITRGGFGFGDVQYAPLVGAATASVSWSMLAWALVLGSLVGAAVGAVRLLRRRGGPFAYGPSILSGAYLATGAVWLTT